MSLATHKPISNGVRLNGGIYLISVYDLYHLWLLRLWHFPLLDTHDLSGIQFLGSSPVASGNLHPNNKLLFLYVLDLGFTLQLVALDQSYT